MVGNISYDVFGDYNQFLSGILLFNKDTLNLIDQYMSENPGEYTSQIRSYSLIKIKVYC